ncbi:MAG: ECF transporter S component [Clostridia bacterium]|nr:ECF transporter S component [Clostridia bacterium]
MQNNIQVPNQQQHAARNRILIYLLITLLVNAFGSSLVKKLIYSLLDVFKIPGIAGTLIYFVLSGIIMCSVKGFLYRKFVFKSKKNVLPAIAVLTGLQIASSILSLSLVQTLAAPDMGYQDLYPAVNLVLFLVTFILGYVLQNSRLYVEAENSSPYRSKQFSAASDNDPTVLGVDLEDIEKRKSPRNKKSRGFFNRFDVENDGDRVIAQSSREAIRVMEHRALDMQHEWNCDDKNEQPVRSDPGRRVIAPGNYSTIQANEHSALDMQHEWNCNDR